MVSTFPFISHYLLPSLAQWQADLCHSSSTFLRFFCLSVSTGRHSVTLILYCIITGLQIDYTFLATSYSRHIYSKLFYCADRTQPLTLQSVSEEDRRLWLDAMDGREPVSIIKLLFVFTRMIIF